MVESGNRFHSLYITNAPQILIYHVEGYVEMMYKKPKHFYCNHSHSTYLYEANFLNPWVMSKLKYHSEGIT